MKTFRSALFLVATALMLVPALAHATALSDLTAATASNTIDNGGNEQVWKWNSLTSYGLEMENDGGTTQSDGAAVLFVHNGGTNSTANITTQGIQVNDVNNGTGSTNIGLDALAAEGLTHNFGVYGAIIGFNAGDAGVWGDSYAETSAATYGVLGTNETNGGYAGYFNYAGTGGYAAAFMGGAVGIGTALPKSLLQVYSGEVQVGSSGVSCATANNGAIRFSGSTLYYCTGTTWTTIGGSGSGTVTSSTAGQVAYYQSTGTTVVGTSTINIVSGNVGIGTASPSLNGTITSPVELNITPTINYGTGVLKLGVANSSAHGNGLMEIGHEGYFSSDEYAWNATIGENLATQYNGTTSVFYTPQTTSYGYAGISFDYGGATHFFGYNGSTTAGATVTPTERLTILSGGNVGIETTSPSYTLQVNGSVAGTSAHVNTSDIRLKKNILPLDIGLNIVTQLKPVTFEWKDEAFKRPKSIGIGTASPQNSPIEDHRPYDPAMQGKQIGFIAQDVEKILPSVVVTEDNAEKTKGMKYSELIPVLVKAIQEQQAQLTKDEATIAAMKAKLGM